MPPVTTQDESGRLSSWDSLVVEACGRIIEFWGFKQNQGRVWALLYLRGRSLTAAELMEDLGLSKGAVSMLTRELEGWGVITRTRGAGAGVYRFEAETDLMQMISRVLGQRETALVSRVKSDLEEALRLAKADGAPDGVVDRIDRMRKLASLVEQAVRVFQQTARLDVARAISVLDVARGRRRRK